MVAPKRARRANVGPPQTPNRAAAALMKGLTELQPAATQGNLLLLQTVCRTVT